MAVQLEPIGGGLIADIFVAVEFLKLRKPQNSEIQRKMLPKMVMIGSGDSGFWNLLWRCLSKSAREVSLQYQTAKKYFRILIRIIISKNYFSKNFRDKSKGNLKNPSAGRNVA